MFSFLFTYHGVLISETQQCPFACEIKSLGCFKILAKKACYITTKANAFSTGPKPFTSFPTVQALDSTKIANQAECKTHPRSSHFPPLTKHPSPPVSSNQTLRRVFVEDQKTLGPRSAGLGWLAQVMASPTSPLPAHVSTGNNLQYLIRYMNRTLPATHCCRFPGFPFRSAIFFSGGDESAERGWLLLGFFCFCAAGRPRLAKLTSREKPLISPRAFVCKRMAGPPGVEK